MSANGWTPERRAAEVIRMKKHRYAQFIENCGKLGIKEEEWWFDIIDLEKMKESPLPSYPISNEMRKKYQVEMSHLRRWLEGEIPRSAEGLLKKGAKKIYGGKLMNFMDYRFSLEEKSERNGQLEMLPAYEMFELVCQAYTDLTDNRFVKTDYTHIKKWFREWTGLYDYELFIQIEKHERAMGELDRQDANAEASGSEVGIKRPAEGSYVDSEAIKSKRFKRGEGSSVVLNDDYNSVNETGGKDEGRIVQGNDQAAASDEVKGSRLSSKDKGKGKAKIGSIVGGKKASKRSFTTK